jgi:hypothetical protein
VRVAGRRHHAGAALPQPLEQELGEQERGEVVEREGALEAVGRDLARREHRAGVVGEHVDALVALEQLGRQPADLVQALEVGDVLVRRAGRGRGGLAHVRRVAADDRDLRAAPRQLDRCGAPDPARRAGQHHQGHRA